MDNLPCMQIFWDLDLELVCQKNILIIWASEWVPLAQLEDNGIFHSPTLRRGVKWGRVLYPRHATGRQWNLFALSVAEWHENWQNKYAEGTTEERWGYLAPTISHLFPSFISHQQQQGSTKNALAWGTINYGLELVIPTGSPPWVKNVCPGSKELRSTCLKKHKLFILSLSSSPYISFLLIMCYVMPDKEI